jgi:hypothetical protein
VLVGAGGALVGAALAVLVGAVPSTEERIARRYVEAHAAYARCRDAVAAERRRPIEPGRLTVTDLDRLDVPLAHEVAARCADEEREQQAATLTAELRIRGSRR